MKKANSLMILMLIAILATGVYSAVQDNIVSKNISKYKAGDYEIDLKYPYLVGTAPLDIAVNKEIKSILSDSYNEIIDSAKSKPEFQKGREYFTLSDFVVGISKVHVFSGYIRISEDTGGAHPNTYTKVVNYHVTNTNEIQKISYKDIFKSDQESLDGLNTFLTSKINDEKKARDITDSIKSIDPYLYNSFIVEPDGIRWIFDRYSVGAYYEGIYEIKTDWREIAKFLNQNILNDLIDAYKSKVRIRGTVDIDDVISVPGDAVCRISLASAPNSPAETSKVVQAFEMPFSGTSKPFDVAFDFKGLSERNDYIVIFDVLYDGVIEYTNTKLMPLTKQGWSESTLVVLQNVNSNIKAEGRLKDLGYVRFSGTAYYLERMMVPSNSYLEFRVMDGDKIYAKKFLNFSADPADFDVTFPARKMSDSKDYGFIILLRSGDKTLFKSDIYNFDTSNWNSIPKDIKLVRSIE